MRDDGSSIRCPDVARIRVGHGDDLGMGPLALQDHGRVLHGQLRSDVAIDPLDRGSLVCHAPLGDQIVDVGGPILNR